MNNNSPISKQKNLHSSNSFSSDASKSLTDLIESLSKEQLNNQNLLLSLSFITSLTYVNVMRVDNF